jgi:DNA-binding PadR family transcriptional regulator
MHGYKANLVLAQRQIGDWAGVSRPQVYYSLEKLARLGLIRPAEGGADNAAGPERSAFTTTAAGRTALAGALEREDWTTDRDRPAFLTWLALSWKARPGVAVKQIERRKRFVEAELKRHEEMLVGIKAEVGHRFHEAVWMVSYRIEQLRMERKWLRRLAREMGRRAPALRPDYSAEAE